MRKTILAFLFVPALTGCGYRAPMHPSYLPVVTDSTLYAGIRPGYQQLAALMEKDTGMKPVEGNTVSLVFEGQENLDRMLDDVRAAEVSIYTCGRRPRPGSTCASSWTSRPTATKISGN